jgi:hypothetical protein
MFGSFKPAQALPSDFRRDAVPPLHQILVDALGLLDTVISYAACLITMFLDLKIGQLLTKGGASCQHQYDSSYAFQQRLLSIAF